jgi:PPK2 family polyphosphate:nucleotide phosphotransferase
VKPGGRPDLAAIDPSSTKGAPGGKEETEAALFPLHEQLAELQTRLWAASDQSLLVVLQSMDAGGKDGTIKHVFVAVNPQGTRVAAFKQPTDEELAHDFLWRVHKVTPSAGEIVVFNRSHYEDVLVVRVHELVPEKVWRPRYELIREFEHSLHTRGTTVVKLFFHLSKDEQADRFRARLDDPTKRWKFRRGDLDDRAKWDDFMAAYADAIAETSTAEAPWYVVPADHKWYRNWAVSRILIETLEHMDPHYPEPAEDLNGIKIT